MSDVNQSDVRLPGKPRVVLLREDEIAYGELLREAFPGVRFLDCFNVLEKPERPPARTSVTIEECRHKNVFVVFDPAWQPQWHCDEASTYNVWNFGEGPYPNASLEFYSRIEPWADEPRSEGDDREHVPSGRIYFRYVAGEKEQERIVRKALRLFEKIASNKRLLRLRPDTREVLDADFRGGPWVGHHARRWCLERPDRFLDGLRDPVRPWAFRPWPESE